MKERHRNNSPTKKVYVMTDKLLAQGVRLAVAVGAFTIARNNTSKPVIVIAAVVGIVNSIRFLQELSS